MNHASCLWSIRGHHLSTPLWRLDTTQIKFVVRESLSLRRLLTKRAKEERSVSLVGAVKAKVTTQELAHPGYYLDAMNWLLWFHICFLMKLFLLQVSDTNTIYTRHPDSAPWEIDARIISFLQQAKLYDFHLVAYGRVDRAMITALLERWRQETHTFHLP